MQSGAKTALASLWYVSDVGTLALMREFYEPLKVTSTKAEALRRTQAAMARGDVRVEDGALRFSGGTLSLPENLNPGIDRDFRNPYFWSGFTAIGSPW